MGVTGLWKLIEQSGKPVPLETLEGKVLAIDISIWLHQVVKGYQDGRGGAVHNAHLIGLFNRLCKLLFFRIKPVFVFDGGMPQLKRITIEKRSMQRSKTQNEANRVEQILLETLAKEKIVQQALGKSVKDIVSPRKAQQLRENRKQEEDMFVLPPIAESLGVSPLSDDSDVEEMTETEEQKLIGDLTASEIAKIDVTHPLFKSLPADKRHAILFELKETRKQSSWGRLHEMPPDGGNFSEFQMKRLLKRRNVQVSLEEAELEMGGKSLTLMELDQLLQEDGIVEGEIKGQRIASNENARFVYIKDTLKAIEESKEEAKVDTIPEVDIDLQMAIEMSLQQADESYPANLTQVDVAKDSDIKLSTPQRQYLKQVNKGPAREYMLEYGILNDDTIQDMFKEPKKAEGAPTDAISITSSTDSDFVDVPEDDFSSEVLVPPAEPFPMPDETPSKDFRIEDLKRVPSVVEVKIDPKKATCDDLFADVFEGARATGKRSFEDVEDDDPDKTQPLDVTDDEDILKGTKEHNSPSSHKKLKLDVTLDETLPEIVPSLLKRKEVDTSELERTPKKAKHDVEIPEMIAISDSEGEQERPVVTKTGSHSQSSTDVLEIIELSPQKPVASIPPQETETTPIKKVTPSKEPPRANFQPRPSSSKYVAPPAPKNLPKPVMNLPEDEDALREMEQELAAKHKSLEKEMNKKDRHATSVTERMSVDCQELLKLFGVPFIVAPMEAEAQCAFLNKYKLVDGIISDDSDVWLFGGSVVYKNFFDNKKVVMEFKSENIKNLFQMEQKTLIQLGMLVGSDYTSGLSGIGPVTAMEIIAAFTSNEDCSDEAAGVISCLRKFRDWVVNGKQVHTPHLQELKQKLKKVEVFEGFPNLEVVKAYLYPEVDLNEEPFSWGTPNVEALYEMTRRTLGWTANKTDDILGPVLKKLKEKQSQASIKNYFKTKEVKSHTDLIVSKRTEKSIRRLAGEATVEEPKKKKKRSKKTKISGDDDAEVLSISTPVIENSPEKSSNTVKFVRPSPKKTPEKAEVRKERVPRIPDPHPPIPQRIKDQKEQEEKKKRAAQVIKKKNKKE